MKGRSRNASPRAALVAQVAVEAGAAHQVEIAASDLAAPESAR